MTTDPDILLDVTCPPLPRTRTHSAASALVAAVLGLTACDMFGQDDEPTIDTRNLAADELEARCEFLARCGFMPDQDTCLDVEREDAGLLQALGGSAFGRVDFNPKAAAAWIDALRDLSCVATDEIARALADAREAVFKGTIEAGGACFADDECVSGNVCDRSACSGNQLCCTGECVPFRILAERDACPLDQDEGRITSRCDDTTYCQPTETAEGDPPPTHGTCVLRVENGLPCETDDACVDGQRCDTQDTRTCFKLSAHEAACNASLTTNPCLEVFDACDPGSSTCQIAPGPGDPCPQGACAGWARCEAGDGEDPATCVALARRGEACDVIPCLGDLVCRDATCQDLTTALVCLEGDPPPPPEMDGG